MGKHKPKSKLSPSRAAQYYLTNYKKAVLLLAMKGEYHPHDRDMIDIRYKMTRRRLYEYIANLENAVEQLQKEAHGGSSTADPHVET